MNIPPFYHFFFENMKIKESEFINLTYCKSLVQIRRFGTMQRFQKDQEEVVASVPLSGAGQKSYRTEFHKLFFFGYCKHQLLFIEAAKLFDFLLWGIRRISIEKKNNIITIACLLNI